MNPPTLRDCSPGHSFFKFIDDVWPDVPPGVQPRYTLHRICTLMRRMRAQRVIIEDLDPEAREWGRIFTELQAIRKRVGRNLPSVIVRKFTFTQSQFNDVERIGALPEEDLLGYAILITIEFGPSSFHSYILESVIRAPGRRVEVPGRDEPWEPILNNYLHVKKSFPCHIGTDAKPMREYNLVGSFFCQQNQITGVCAHACAAMVLNNCKELAGIVTSEDINRIVGIDHENKMLNTDWASNSRGTHEGLSEIEIQAVLQSWGFEVTRLTFGQGDIGNYREFLYGFVESGYPALLGFTTAVSHHIVPVLGHTLNSDSWAPQAFAGYVGEAIGDRKYLSTLDWVADFLVHDDNLGMYFCLPGHSFRPEGRPNPAGRFTPTVGIGVFPQGSRVSLHSYQAEDLAFLRLTEVYNFFQASGTMPFVSYYPIHLYPQVSYKRTAVLRAFLVTQDQYLRHLCEKDSEDVQLTEAERTIITEQVQGHSRFWLVEVTEPELYVGNRSKVVDVLIDHTIDYVSARACAGTSAGVILMRFPGFALWPGGTGYAFDLLRTCGHRKMFTLDSMGPGTADW